MVAFLIGKGANLDTTAYGGGTPLMSAAERGHRDVLQKLLEARAKTDMEDSSGRTALSYAAEKGHAEVVKALLAAKADIQEELDRLRAHVAAANDLIGSGQPAGRQFEFLAQEFNREANTICSKASDIETTRIGLELKTVIGQLREQVQNIE